MDTPKLNPALTYDERMAVARDFARKAAAETLQAEGIAPTRVNLGRLEAEGVALIYSDWLGQALEPSTRKAKP